MEVHVEPGRLDDGVMIVYRRFASRTRMAYDPHQITEAAALNLLYQHQPHLVGMRVVHRADV